MKENDLKLRTMKFGICVIRLVESLPKTRTADILGRQLLRSATSVGANYRAACRAKSTADFVSKLGTVEEEADESMYWMEMMIEVGLISGIDELMEEANQLIAMIVASIKTTRHRL